MTTSLSRRAFLGLHPPRLTYVIRPPWAHADEQFTKLCTRCNDCLTACPEGIITKGAEGYPIIDVDRGNCTLCGECTARCAPGALMRHEQGSLNPPWRRHATLGDSCLMKAGMDCRHCLEACPQGAISISPTLDFGYQIALDVQACHGCGKCASPCPTQAITMAYPHEVL